MPTMQDLVDLARLPLNDEKVDGVPAGWGDTELLGYAHAALRILLAKRPDLFIGQFASPPVAPAIGAAFPLDDRVYTAVADYVTAKAMYKNDELAVAGKASSFMQLAAGGVT